MNATTTSTFPVTVTVSDLTDPPTVHCSPTTVVVDKSNALVVFNLATEGYAFPTTGAIIVQNGGSEFPNLWYVNASQVALHDLCAVPAEYNYTVIVEESATGKRLRVDPKISNEPY